MPEKRLRRVAERRRTNRLRVFSGRTRMIESVFATGLPFAGGKIPASSCCKTSDRLLPHRWGAQCGGRLAGPQPNVAAGPV